MFLRPSAFSPGIRPCLPSWRYLHASPVGRNQFPDHYEILEVPHDASAKDIKRKFYELSKKHHPDLNPGDPNASARFVKLSNAYAVIGNPQKRELYDRDFMKLKAKGTNSPAYTYRGPAGSRPASGLSRRRTQFKGPPPSYYKTRTGTHADSSAGHGGYTKEHAPGTGFGGTTGRNDDVRHFNFRRHEQTYERYEKRWAERARAEAMAQMKERMNDARRLQPERASANSFTISLVAIGGILLLSTLMSGVAINNMAPRKRSGRDDIR